MRCPITKAVLTDSSYMVQGVVFRSLLRHVPLEILGQVAPRLSLQEIVEITNGVCYVSLRIRHEKICQNLVKRNCTLLVAKRGHTLG